MGCEALSIITDSLDFPKLWTQQSEVHSTPVCNRITNCNLVAMSYQLQTRTHKVAVNSFRTQLLWKQSLPRSGGRNAAGTPSLQKSVKAHKPNKKYEAHNRQWRIPAMSRQPPAQQAKSKKRSGSQTRSYRHLKESASHHVFAFAQLCRKALKLTPTG